VTGVVRITGAAAASTESVKLRVRRVLDGKPADEQIVRATKAKGSKGSKGSKGKDASAAVELEYMYWAQLGETLEIVPTSTSLLFYPDSRSVTVARRECPAAVEAIEGREGLFIDGSVTPASAGVEITVTEAASDPNAEGTRVGNAVTDAAGRYRVGPLYDDRPLLIDAAKPGFHFAEVDNRRGHFTAVALAELVVAITDARTGEAVSGVLVSVSSGSSSSDGAGGAAKRADASKAGSGKPFRTNRRTPASGEPLVLSSLRPGEYFLKPVSPEHKFNPPSARVSVAGGGARETVVFKGERVAWGVRGRVVGLTGNGVSGVAVRAVLAQANNNNNNGNGNGNGNAGGDSGDAATAAAEAVAVAETDRASGAFWLRGLSPDVEYELVCEPQGGSRAGSWRALGKTKVVIRGADVDDIEIVGVEAPRVIDVFGEIRLAIGGDGADGGAIDETSALLGAEVRLFAAGAQQPMRVITSPPSRFFQFFNLPRDDYRLVVVPRPGISAGASGADTARPVDILAADGSSPGKVVVTYRTAAAGAAQEVSVGSVLGLLIVLMLTVAAVKRDEVEDLLKRWRSQPRNPAPAATQSAGRGSGGNKRG
jgi:hypothetical protein